jgi:hypothetical protein
MDILITQSHFGLGGTESYSATVAEGLEQLGHSVTIYAPQASELGREMAAARGLVLRTGEVVPGGADAVLAQDSASAHLLAGRDPAPRQIFIIHGLAPFEHPPRGLDPAPTVVVLNDRTARRAAALAERPPVVRLRQPIDISRFKPSTPVRLRARRLLLLSNALGAGRLRMLEAVCADLGLELLRAGGDSPTTTPQERITEADIVVGYGRSVLEGMAMGRPAYVWERAGGDGWVTPESYAAFEADGFAGNSGEVTIDGEKLRRDLAAYDPDLGDLGFELVRRHHSAAKHVEELVALLEGAGAPRRQEGAETISLLVRAERRAVFRAEAAERTHGHLFERIGHLERELHETRLGLSAAELAGAEATGEAEARRAAEAQLAELLGSRSWRALAPLRRLRASLRGY